MSKFIQHCHMRLISLLSSFGEVKTHKFSHSDVCASFPWHDYRLVFILFCDEKNLNIDIKVGWVENTWNSVDHVKLFPVYDNEHGRWWVDYVTYHWYKREELEQAVHSLLEKALASADEWIKVFEEKMKIERDYQVNKFLSKKRIGDLYLSTISNGNRYHGDEGVVIPFRLLSEELLTLLEKEIKEKE